jgi:hypothetical protein
MTWDLVERCNHGVPTSSPSGELLAQERVLEEIRRSWAKSLVRSEAIADEVHERGTFAAQLEEVLQVSNGLQHLQAAAARRANGATLRREEVAIV